MTATWCSSQSRTRDFTINHQEPSTAIELQLSEHVTAIKATIAESSGIISEIVDRLCSCFEQGGKLLICGNGGSAADAQHLAAEFMNRMRVDHEPWPAIALTTDTSVITSIANDASYDDVFARQVEALGRTGDMLFALSTSGRSPGVIRALRAARLREIFTVSFTGEAGAEPMGQDSNLLLAVASRDTARIQEVHEFVYHFIASAVEARLADRKQAGTAAHTREGANGDGDRLG